MYEEEECAKQRRYIVVQWIYDVGNMRKDAYKAICRNKTEQYIQI